MRVIPRQLVCPPIRLIAVEDIGAPRESSWHSKAITAYTICGKIPLALNSEPSYTSSTLHKMLNVGSQEMKYTPEHAAKALELVERLYPSVTPRPEYAELICVLRDPKRWKDAHDVFDTIRINITLPNDRKSAQGLDALFAFIAEAAAKTAFNCTDTDAPFDEDSFGWLLRNEQDFLREQKHGN